MTETKPAIEPRKQQIIDAAFKVFMEKGFVKASMNEIILASGLSKGGVYHHFASKDDLIIGVVDVVSEMKKDSIRQMISREGSVRDRLEYMIKMMMSSLGGTPHNANLSIDMMTLNLTNERFREKMKLEYEIIIQLLADLISSGIDSGEFYQKINARQVAIGIGAIFDGLSIQHQMFNEEMDIAAIGIQTTHQLIDGISKKAKLES